jgi:hypothetical protein
MKIRVTPEKIDGPSRKHAEGFQLLNVGDVERIEQLRIRNSFAGKRLTSSFYRSQEKLNSSKGAKATSTIAKNKTASNFLSSEKRRTTLSPCNVYEEPKQLLGEQRYLDPIRGHRNPDQELRSVSEMLQTDAEVPDQVLEAANYLSCASFAFNHPNESTSSK